MRATDEDMMGRSPRLVHTHDGVRVVTSKWLHGARNRCVGALILACFATTAALGQSLPASRSVVGPVILARSGEPDVYLWDATADVTALVADHLLGVSGLRALEESALAAFAANDGDSKARTVSLRVVFARTGAVSATYGGAAFAGFEKVFTLTTDRRALSLHRSEWQQEIGDGRPPAQVKLEITGSLPPS